MTVLVTRFKCVVCGKVTAGRLPRLAWNKGTLDHDRRLTFRYDTDFRYPRKHKDASGQTCKGSFMEAEWVEVE